jgi:hypothetical protein
MEVTQELIEKVARRLCVKDGKNPDASREGRRYEPNWMYYEYRVRSILGIFEAMHEVLSEETNNG